MNSARPTGGGLTARHSRGGVKELGGAVRPDRGRSGRLAAALLARFR